MNDTFYNKLLLIIILAYICIEFQDMRDRLNSNKYTTKELLFETLWKAMWIGIFITLYLNRIKG